MSGKTLIVSDLHLGNGGQYDIFAGGAELPSLIARFASAGNSIILNGDSIDFLMNEDPLELEEGRALSQIDKSLADPATAAVLAELGKALAAGASVTILLGNHDIELALGPVQDRVRAALKQPHDIASKLRFERGSEPSILTVGGARILVTHGHHNDPWNRVNFNSLPGPGAPSEASCEEYVYSAGSRLVKTLANPLKRKYGMRFADLIKPDFQGGVLTALAVNPSAVRTIFQGSTVRLLWELFKSRRGPDTFDEGGPPLGLSEAVDSAGLNEEEKNAISAVLDPPKGAQTFGDSDEENAPLDSARKKLGRAGLRWYANAQRSMAGDEGRLFFSFNPSDDEWKETQRLADKFNVNAVIFGHTHAARFKSEGDLTFVNTGTWIWLMSLPPPEAPDSEWTSFIETCQQNPKLDPKAGKTIPLITRFTGAVIEPHSQSGALVSLVEWKDGQLISHGQSHVKPAQGAH